MPVDTQLADRSHLIDAGDAAELPLQRSRDRRRHGFRTGARQACRHTDHRKFHLRKRRYRKPGESQHPDINSANVNSDVPIGRLMKGAEIFMTQSPTGGSPLDLDCRCR